jgi:hypothetical protein
LNPACTLDVSESILRLRRTTTENDSTFCECARGNGVLCPRDCIPVDLTVNPIEQYADCFSIPSLSVLDMFDPVLVEDGCYTGKNEDKWVDNVVKGCDEDCKYFLVLNMNE